MAVLAVLAVLAAVAPVAALADAATGKGWAMAPAQNVTRPVASSVRVPMLMPMPMRVARGAQGRLGGCPLIGLLLFFIRYGNLVPWAHAGVAIRCSEVLRC